MPRKKTAADYKLLAQSFGYEWLGPEVATTNIKTFWLCDKGHKMEKTYSHLKAGRKCLQCTIEASRNTPENYHRIAQLHGFEWLGPEVAGVMIKTRWCCNRGHEWDAKYNHIKNGRGCPHCSNRIPKNAQDHRKLAKSRKFEWLGPLASDTRGKTNWRCNLGHEFSTSYTTLRNSKGRGCPHCAGKAHKTIDDYHALAAQYGYQWLGKELPPTVFGKTLWQCDKGHQWKSPFHTLDCNHGCSQCSLLSRQSKGEKRIAKFLTALDIMYSRQKAFEGCKDKKVLRFDFFFTYAGQRFLIEYNGQQHYKPVGHWGGKEALETSKRRDRIKSNFAAANGLHLIAIPYTHYDRIGTIIIDRLTEVTGENPLTFTDRIGAARGTVEMLEGVQLSFGLENL
jgi:hypothetical protein